MFMGLNNLMKKYHIPDKFHGVNINSAKKYGEFPLQIHSINNHILLTKYINAHKIYRRITTAAVSQPHKKSTICDFSPIFKNSNCESHDL